MHSFYQIMLISLNFLSRKISWAGPRCRDIALFLVPDCGETVSGAQATSCQVDIKLIIHLVSEFFELFFALIRLANKRICV